MLTFDGVVRRQTPEKTEMNTNSASATNRYFPTVRLRRCESGRQEWIQRRSRYDLQVSRDDARERPAPDSAHRRQRPE